MDFFSGAILLLIAALAVHLVEEIKTGFRKQFPLGEIPRTLFIGINVLIYAFCFTTFFLSLGDSAWATLLAWAWAGAMLLNGLGHVGIMLVKRRHFPGGLTAPALILIASYLIVLLATNKQ